MNSPNRLSARDYVAALAASGRYQFTSKEAQGALSVSAEAAKLALGRLAKQGLIASPARGYHVIVPPEYRSLGCLPAEQFIPDLMQRLGLQYYAGLLSAAQFHGAAHHRPQEFQVMLAKARRPIVCGSVRVAFFVHKNIAATPIQAFNTPRGTVLVSTPEATAFDLVGYQSHVGGLDNVATVLGELSEILDPDKLAVIAIATPVPWAQRLGYLLDKVEAGGRALALQAFVKLHAKQVASLLPAAPAAGAVWNENWKLVINAEVEPEL